MGSLMFLAAVIAIVLVVVWSLRNDRAPTGTPTRGMLSLLPGRELPEKEATGKARPGRPVRPIGLHQTARPSADSDRHAAPRGKH